MPAREHVASASIKVDGPALDPQAWTASRRSRCATSAACPTWPRCASPTPRASSVATPPFYIGDEVEIRLGDPGDASPATVFNGEIVTYEPEFRARRRRSRVRAYDKSHRLNRNRRSATFQDMTVADIVRKVVGEAGLQAGRSRATATVAPVRAAGHGDRLRLPLAAGRAAELEVGVVDGKVFLAAPRNGAAPCRRSPGARTLKSFQPRMTGVAAARQVRSRARTRRRSGGRRQGVASRRSSPRRPAEAARQAQGLRRPELLVADRDRQQRRRGRDDRPEHARQARQRLARGRGRRATATRRSRPAARSRSRARQRFGGEYVVTSATHVYGARRLPHHVSRQRPRPAHARRPDAPRPSATGRRALVIGARHQQPRPRQARPRAREVPGARRQHRELLGADGAGRRRQGARHAMLPPGRRRGRRRLRARRHAPRPSCSARSATARTSRPTKMARRQATAARSSSTAARTPRSTSQKQLVIARQGPHDDH